MGAVGEIRYEAVTNWLDEQRIFDELDRDRYRFHLRAADRCYLDHVSAEREKQNRKLEAASGKVGKG